MFLYLARGGNDDCNSFWTVELDGRAPLYLEAHLPPGLSLDSVLSRKLALSVATLDASVLRV